MPNNANLLLLDKHQVEALLLPGAVMDAVQDAFVLHSRREGRIYPVVRELLSDANVFGIKSGDVQQRGLLGFKAAGFWPGNRQLRAEPHQATVLLIDPATGRPLCVIDGNAITTMRTGAAGALGLQRLARSDSKRLCIFGTGVQARIQLDYALMTLTALDEVIYVTADNQPDLPFEARFNQRCSISHTAKTNDAVANCDIIITATPGRGALFDLAAVKPGTHLNSVGADTKGKRELPAGLLDNAKVFVDDLAQAQELGELQWSPSVAAAELGDLVSGKVTFNRLPGDITVFDMTGLALQDLTVARMIFDQATLTKTGSSISWPW